MSNTPDPPLKRGWTTGACATAATRAVLQGLWGEFQTTIAVALPRGETPEFVVGEVAINPVERLTIGGGIGKITKLAQGAMDLRSGRTQVDFVALNVLAQGEGLPDVSRANTALEAANIAGPALSMAIDGQALVSLKDFLADSTVIDIVVIDRAGKILARAGH
ncbi:MAG: hypothetical protein GXP05_11915 [Alphaproteobacteria bacterium]|nr:hypothetical protein [Alphaproteobacteria bacterium]